MPTQKIRELRAEVCLFLGVIILLTQLFVYTFTDKEVSWAIITAGLTCLGLIPAFRLDERRQNNGDRPTEPHIEIPDGYSRSRHRDSDNIKSSGERDTGR